MPPRPTLRVRRRLAVLGETSTRNGFQFHFTSYWGSCVDATICIAQPLVQSKSYRDRFRRLYLDAALIAEAKWSVCALVSADEAGDDAMPWRENLVRLRCRLRPDRQLANEDRLCADQSERAGSEDEGRQPDPELRGARRPALTRTGPMRPPIRPTAFAPRRVYTTGPGRSECLRRREGQDDRRLSLRCQAGGRSWLAASIISRDFVLPRRISGGYPNPTASTTASNANGSNHGRHNSALSAHVGMVCVAPRTPV